MYPFRIDILHKFYHKSTFKAIKIFILPYGLTMHFAYAKLFLKNNGEINENTLHIGYGRNAPE